MYLDDKYILNPAVVIKEYCSKFCLYNKKTENVIEINNIGMEIAKKLQKEHSIQDLINYFSKKYNIPTENILNDIEEFIKTCTDKQFFIRM